VTVALSGDGGDALFAGYNRYCVAGQQGVGRLLSLPNTVRSPLAGLLTSVPPSWWGQVSRRWNVPAAADKAHKLAGVLRSTDRLAAYRSLTTQWEPSELLLAPTSASKDRADAVNASLAPLDAMLLADQLVTLPDDMLVKVDRASMAVALEVRVPFLSPELVELSWRLPDVAKTRDGQGKWVIRQVLGRHVPPALWDRPKIGFDPPLAGWLRGPLRGWAEDLLSPAALRRQGLLRADVVAATWQEHLAGRRNHDYRLWTVLALQSWLSRQVSPLPSVGALA
jgi:asparagine synthase (glutamine-hydrolysing)